MGTILASAIIDRVEALLNDSGNDRYNATTDLLVWLNEAQKEAVKISPPIYVTTANVQLVAGIKQALPTGGFLLIDVTRNMGVAGATPGTPIKIVEKDDLTDMLPTWMTATAAVPTIHYMYSKDNPEIFYVYPGQPASPQYVEISYVKPPADIAAGAAITINDIYVNEIMNYMFYKAYSLNAEFSFVAAQKAVTHYNDFVTAFGRSDLVKRMVNPNIPDKQKRG